MSSQRFFAAGAATAAAAVALSGCGGSDASRPAQQQAPAAPAVTTTRAATGRTLTVPQIVRRVGPSVVAVLVRTSQGGGEGSGVIWDGKGHIVTNNHVVEGARSIVVELRDGRQLSATLVATDPLSDLAVVRVRRDGLPPAAFADSLPPVGATAVAIGSPLGFQNTVTAGIVSGVGRSIPGSGSPSLVDLVQTDAAISPGNSGGALVGADGRLIGINVAYIPPQQGAVALGFAVPAPTVKSVVPQLVAGKRPRHAFLGVSVSDLNPEDAAKLGAARAGLAVVGVQSESPAAKAGIRNGDVIVTFDARRIRTLDQLLTALHRRQPGQAVPVAFARNGSVRTVNITLGDYSAG